MPLPVALHLAALALWTAALVGIPAVLLAFAPHVPRADVLDRLRRAYRGLALPGLILTWVFGLWALLASGAWAEGWFWLKALLVIALSGLHGALAARLKRLEVGGPIPGIVRAAPWLTLGIVLAAAWLAAAN